MSFIGNFIHNISSACSNEIEGPKWLRWTIRIFWLLAYIAFAWAILTDHLK